MNSRIWNEPSHLKPLAESGSQDWSAADHMQSLCKTVLTLHSACLLSQDFPQKDEIGSPALFFFFCLLQNLTVSFGLWDGFKDLFWCESGLSGGDDMQMHERNCLAKENNRAHEAARGINWQLRFHVACSQTLSASQKTVSEPEH